jgi:signal transduction histidine kinase
MPERATPRWIDVLWLLFLGGLALIPPLKEWHKQITLGIIGVVQLFESQFVRVSGRVGPFATVAIKITLATILINHTQGDVAINSAYWPIFLLPVMTAAMYFGPLGTLLWTALASGAYSSYLIPAREQFEITPESVAELVLRILFLFLVAMTVNRFVMDSRVQLRRQLELSNTLAEANRNLKQAQEEVQRAERLAALGQLSAGLAHEIRNPLGVIKGSAEILNQKTAKSEPIVKELAEYIYTEVNRLSALVSRFLDFARPLQLELHAEDIPAILDSCLQTVADQGATAKVSVHRDYQNPLPRAMIDKDFCEQVFCNLLLNACEAMGDQGGDLTVRVRAEQANAEDSHKEREVAVEIEDTGPGVPPEMKEQIFNPFVTTKKTGVGLGLAIVSKIVDAHGGSLKLVSTPQHGACFRVTFPVAEGAQRSS